MSLRKLPQLSTLRQYVILGGMLIVLGFLGFRTVQATLTRLRIEHEIQGLQSDLEKLRQQSGVLRSTVSDLDRPESIEQEARKRLNVAKEGEHTIVLVPEGGNQQATSQNDPKSIAPEAQPQKDPSNPIRWWRKFFGP